MMHHLAWIAARLPTAEFDIDDDGYVVSKHWFFPEKAEIIWGGLASIIVFLLLGKFAVPALKKGMADRTRRIQNELDSATSDRTDAVGEAERIRQAMGDIESERARLLAEADAQAEALLTDGRARLAQEILDAEARAEADIATAANRAGDELRAEISRLAAEATERVVAETLDAQLQQDLIEAYIAKVGASR
jgi:F-type H+-transporting ATPase subunit b